MNDLSPQFGKYRLIAELGRGGMATVYLAMSDSGGGIDFSKLVVIKRLREHIAADPDFVVMLQDEGRLAARLNHQNVIQTIEVGEYRDELYLAMEFLDGQPLHRIQRRAAVDFPVELQLTILSDVLAGVHYAHELRDFDGAPLNIVHRDVTPHNVFVTYEGQVKVLDFGIAKAEGRAANTKHGVVKGKLAYMAPEQARGQLIDRRTDIFSVGVMLFEAATGQRYWDKMSDSEMLRALFRGVHPTSPRERVPTVDPGLDAICRKALAADPADRYETADDFQVDLEEYMQAKAPRVRQRRIGAWLGDLFADRRALTRETIEAQVEHVRGKPSTADIVNLEKIARNAFHDEVEINVDDEDISSNETRLVASSRGHSGLTMPSAAEQTASLPDMPMAVAEPPPASAPAAWSRPSLQGRRLRIAILAAVAACALVVAAVASFASARTKEPAAEPATGAVGDR